MPAAPSQQRVRQQTILRLTATIVLLIAAFGLWTTDVAIAPRSMVPMLGVIVALGAATIYCHARAMPRPAIVADTMLLFVIANIGLLPITYLVMRFNLPLADGWLMATDRAVGFDWVGFVKAVDGSPALSSIVTVAYSSFGPQLFLLPAFFALLRDPSRGGAMVLAYCLIVLAASLTSIWFPAKGAFVGYALDGSQLHNLSAHYGYAFLQEFDALRSEAPFVMALDRIEGLLTFPSVHAAVAVLCTWAALGSRILWLPVLILNMAMLVSAISNGGHYLIDLPAGGLLAALAITAATHILPTSIGAARRDEHRLRLELRRALHGRNRGAVGPAKPIRPAEA